MRDHKPETTSERKSGLSQRVVQRQTEKLEEEGSLLPRRDPLAQVVSGSANPSSAGAHAAILKRAMASQPSLAQHALLELQRQYGNRYVQRVLPLARKAKGEMEASPEAEQAIQRARGGGQALDSGVRTQMEPAFGADFSGVRVHTDSEADILNRDLNARAFTAGLDIFFRQGAYNPGSSTGRELVAHELTHVAQQTRELQGELTIDQPGDKCEQEADQMARAVMQREQQTALRGTDKGLVSRQAYEEEEEEQPIQTKTNHSLIRRQLESKEEGEEPIQAKVRYLPVQRQTEEREEKEELIQTKVAPAWAQRQDKKRQIKLQPKPLPAALEHQVYSNTSQISAKQFKQHNVPSIVRQESRTRGVQTAKSSEPEVPKEPEPVMLRLEEIHLRPVRQYPISIANPYVINLGHRYLFRNIRTAASQSADLRFLLGYLEYTERTGERHLGVVQEARAALGRRARGRRGEYLREAIKTYVSANREVTTKLLRVRASQRRVAEKTARVRTVVLAGRLLKARREEEAATQEVADVQARIKRAQDIADKALDIASNLLQGKWKDAGIDLAKFVGGEIIKAGVEAAFAPELQLAQSRLNEAKDNLVQFQDERQVAALEAAAAALDAANLDADADQNELIRVAQSAELAYVTLNEALRNMGFRKAAEALDARATVMKAADDALRKLLEYEDTINSIAQRSEGLKSLNRALADLMASSGGSSIVPNEDHRTEMFDAASFNESVLERIERWTRNELVLIGNARNFVEGGDYLRQYNEIDNALREALIAR